jgi:hypothetical protein
MAAAQEGPTFATLDKRRDFWAGLTVALAALVLALGLVLWYRGDLRGWRWVCWPASMGCWALATLLRRKSGRLEKAFLALATALLLAGFVLLFAGR